MQQDYEEITKYELIKPDITLPNHFLGEGVFAKVEKGIYQRHGVKKEVAIKAVKPGKYASDDLITEVQNYLFLSRHKVPFITGFYGHYGLKIVLELLPYTLADKIRPVICGLFKVSKEYWDKKKYVPGKNYFLLATFDNTGCFFYSDSKSQTIQTIPVSMQDFVKLQKIHRTKYQPNALLLPEQLTEIENITGHVLEKTDGLPFQQLQYISWQLGLVYRYFAEIGFIVADPKPDNILLTGNGTIKLCDLGMSFHVDEPQLGARGSAYYMAPETMDISFHRKRVVGNTLASDIYSVGLLLFCMLVIKEEFPYSWFTDEGCLHYYVVTKRGRPPFPADFNDPGLQNIITSAWAHNPAARPTAANLFLMIEDWIKKTAPDLSEKIRMELEKVACKSNDTISGYSQLSQGRHLFFKPKPLVEDPVVSDYSPGLWK